MPALALGLVVLATFIGAEGLGTEVWKAIYKLRVGWSLEGGLCIVFMAFPSEEHCSYFT